MGLISFGGKKSSERTSSQSSSYGEGQNIGLSGSYLDAGQRAAQEQLQGSFFNRLPTMFGRTTGATNEVNTRYRMNQGQYGQLANQAGAQAGQFYNAANQGLAGLGQFASGQNPYLQAQIAQLGMNIGQQFREQILPGLGSQFAQAGQRGGSRHALAAGLGADRAMQQFAQGATALGSNAYNQQLAANQALAQYGMSGFGQAQNTQLAAQQGQLAGVQGMASFMPQAQNAQMMPFQIGASVIGAPSVLNYGLDYGYNIDSSQSSSKGKSSSSGLDLGFG